MSDPWIFFTQELEEQKHLLRTRSLLPVQRISPTEILIQGQKKLDLSSNDYLGLSFHAALTERSREFLQLYGNSASASRLISGTISPLISIEKKLSTLKQTEEALLFNSGYQANSSLLPTFADQKSLILLDRLCHSSLIQGALLSQATLLRFHHNDLSHLEKLLRREAKKKYSRIFIVSESLFSMDGDLSPLDSLIEIAKTFHAILYIDEAHATGLFGPKGMGLTVGKEIPIVMGTFGKALGSFGAYVACSALLKDYLINFCKGFIYSTALPPSTLGAIDAALDIVPSLETERKTLLQNSLWLRTALREDQWDLGSSSTHIIPLILKNESAALKLSEKLFQEGFFAHPIRPPTVPEKTSRLRFSLSSHHSLEDLQLLRKTLKTLKNTYDC